MAVFSVVLACAVLMYGGALAAPMSNSHYQIDAQTMNNFGGQGSSGSYSLLGSGGEAIVGNGSGGSYKLGAGFVSQTEKSLELQLAEGGLAARYAFDTGNGAVAYDVSGNDNNVRFEPGSQSPGWSGSGKFQGAAVFDGGDLALAPHTTSLSATEFTVSVWIKPSALPSSLPVIVSKESSATNRNYSLVLNSDRTVAASSSFGGTQQAISSTQQLNLGEYHQIVYVVGGGTQRIYVNGQLGATGSYSGAADIQGSPLTIGDRLDGELDELRVYNRAFSENEVKWLYEAHQQGVLTAVAIPEVTTGESQSTELRAIVRTDYGGYDLAISQDGPLTNTASAATIPAVNNGGTIALPASWTEGTTLGFGFSVTGGTGIDPKWSSAYAPLPASATTFHGKSGLSGGVKELTSLEFRLDVAQPQESGHYQNVVTITATARP